MVIIVTTEVHLAACRVPVGWLLFWYIFCHTFDLLIFSTSHTFIEPKLIHKVYYHKANKLHQVSTWVCVLRCWCKREWCLFHCRTCNGKLSEFLLVGTRKGIWPIELCTKVTCQEIHGQLGNPTLPGKWLLIWCVCVYVFVCMWKLAPRLSVK